MSNLGGEEASEGTNGIYVMEEKKSEIESGKCQWSTPKWIEGKFTETVPLFLDTFILV